jgi:hypothetical protein
MSSKVYFKATPSSATTGTMTLSSTGLSSNTRNVSVDLVPIGAALSIYGGASSIVKDQCTKISLTYTDEVGTVPSVNPISFNFSSSNSGNAYVHYYDNLSNCNAGTAVSPSFVMSPVGNSYYFYVKIDSGFYESYLYLNLSGGPTTYVSTSLNVTAGP